MWKDPIVEEIRRLREQYASQFNYDIDSLFRDIQKRQDKAGKKWSLLRHEHHLKYLKRLK